MAPYDHLGECLRTAAKTAIGLGGASLTVLANIVDGITTAGKVVGIVGGAILTVVSVVSVSVDLYHKFKSPPASPPAQQKKHHHKRKRFLFSKEHTDDLP